MHPDTPIHIAILDDHAIVRDGIAAMLLGHVQFRLVGSAGNGRQFLDHLSQWNPDLVLLDIRLPGISGLEVARQIQLHHPDIRVLMLTANVDTHSLQEAIRLGARGFLPKHCDEKELVEAIQKVASGHSYFGKHISELVYQSLRLHIRYPEQQKAKALTAREIEIIRLFAEGFSYKEVAEKLSISASTVDSHRKNIQKKLGLKSIVELVKYAIKEGIIDL